MQVEHRQLESMGTRLDMVFPGMEAESCDALVKHMKAELDRIEGLFSIYRPDSEISLLNSHAHAGTIKLSRELEDLLIRVREYHGETRGYFDIGMKPVQDFWKESWGKANKLPASIGEIAGMHHMVFEKEGLRFTRKGVCLDLGGIGKGYAIERLLPLMEEARIGCALISFGESLVYGLGSHPYGDSWKVSIASSDLNKPLVFDLKDEALSSSGNTLNNQKKFADSGHIVNPVTHQMAYKEGLVSVKAKDPVRAEVFSTALFSAGLLRSEEIFKEISGIESSWVISEM